jgi:hypothetical protein
MVTRTVNNVATMGCLDRLHEKEPCKIHLEATFYRVGAEELKAVREGGSVEEVR